MFTFKTLGTAIATAASLIFASAATADVKPNCAPGVELWSNSALPAGVYPVNTPYTETHWMCGVNKGMFLEITSVIRTDNSGKRLIKVVADPEYLVTVTPRHVLKEVQGIRGEIYAVRRGVEENGAAIAEMQGLCTARKCDAEPKPAVCNITVGRGVPWATTACTADQANKICRSNGLDRAGKTGCLNKRVAAKKHTHRKAHRVAARTVDSAACPAGTTQIGMEGNSRVCQRLAKKSQVRATRNTVDDGDRVVTEKAPEAIIDTPVIVERTVTQRASTITVDETPVSTRGITDRKSTQ